MHYDERIPNENVPVFAIDDLPRDGYWQIFRKKVNTHMTRIDGPFIVETSEGPLRCEDGWLAIDARGYPYPIADDEKALIYEIAPPSNDEVAG